MRRATSLFPFLLSLALAGCTNHFQQVKLAPRSNIHSIVSLSPSTTEIVASDAPGTLKGKTKSDNWPNMSNGAEIVASVKPDYEKIKALNPDLIVYDASLYGPDDIAKIKSLGFDTFEFKADTVDGFESELWSFGNKVGQQTNISDYIDRIETQVGTAKGDPPKPSPKVAVLMAGRGGSPMINGTKSFISDVVRIAGGDPVGPEVDRFVPSNPESLVSENPDVIIVPTTGTSAAGDVDSILKDPRLQSVKAVQTKNVKALDQDVVLRKGSRVDLFVSAMYRAVGTKGAQ